MGSEWGELDLLPWARQALPEYLISCVRHPADWDSIVARTPWENLAIEIAEVEVDGSISKCGKTHQALLEFDLVIGMRVNVVRQIPYFGEDERHEWPAIVQVLHFEAHSTAAEIAMALDEVPDDFVDEVSWFLREGMGSRYIWHALQAWRAAAFRRWLRMPPPAIEEPLGIDAAEPPPFRQEEQRLALARRSFDLPGPRPQPGPEESGTRPSRPSASVPGNPSESRGGEPGPRPSRPSASLPDGGSGGALPSAGAAPASRAARLREAILAPDSDPLTVFPLMDAATLGLGDPETGRRALHCCVLVGSEVFARMAIAARAQVDAPDAAGQTPLALAARRGDAGLTRLLLDARAEVAQEAPGGARHPGAEGEVRRLLEERQRPRRWGEALLRGIQEKDARSAEAAIDAGGDVGLVDEKGDGPLVLLAKGRWSDEAGQARLAERCARAGADVNAQNRQGGAPLHFAAHRGSSRLLAALLDLRADPALTNGEGSTPLMFAAHSGREDICRQLLEAYSRTDATNSFGLTAEQIARKRGFESCAVLIQVYALAPKELPRACEASDCAPTAVLDDARLNALERHMAKDAKQESQRKEQANVLVVRDPATDSLAAGRTRDKNKELRRLADGDYVSQEASGSPDRRRRDWDYTRWEKIATDTEKRDDARARIEFLEQNPQYIWRRGAKMRVLV